MKKQENEQGFGCTLVSNLKKVDFYKKVYKKISNQLD
jgi:hypothetical protein